MAEERLNGFRRTLVGSKRRDSNRADRGWDRFRRTLVGSKRDRRRGELARSVGFRRTLVGSKRRCGLQLHRGRRVSDEPSWGRSEISSLPDDAIIIVSDEPSWGRSAKSADASPASGSVSDEPSWGRSVTCSGWYNIPIVFQTNPRGVEAGTGTAVRGWQDHVSDEPSWGRSSSGISSDRRLSSFQTNPRGVEAHRHEQGSDLSDSFRRTLVGSKPRVEMSRLRVGGVSDEPSWGRSTPETCPTCGEIRFRRTLVGSKQLRQRRDFRPV